MTSILNYNTPQSFEDRLQRHSASKVFRLCGPKILLNCTGDILYVKNNGVELPGGLPGIDANGPPEARGIKSRNDFIT